MTRPHVVITTIFPPSEAVLQLRSLGVREIVVVGDKKTPPGWRAEGVHFYSWDDDGLKSFESFHVTPINHYSRKNLGYLKAIELGADNIFDTDDDNIPLASFGFPPFSLTAMTTEERLGFINSYSFFTSQRIWPRGLPLAQITRDDSELPLTEEQVEIGVWQGLANGDPDVDAIYRLTSDEACIFEERPPVVLGHGTWSPFNSQSTLFRRELFPLLYLPVSVSFRFTDILRSYVAQPIMWAMGYRLGFTKATVFQKRNPHDYLSDFVSEIPMYLSKDSLKDKLFEMQSTPGSTLERLARSYALLRHEEVVSDVEKVALDAWVADCRRLGFD